MIHVAYDEDAEAGHERAHRLWPNLALAGFTHVYVHQIGENQEEFAEFAHRELLGRL